MNPKPAVDIRELDRAHVWHPYTQMQTAPSPHTHSARTRRVPLHRGRPAPARRNLIVVGQHPRAQPSAIERRACSAGRRTGARDFRRLHASAGRRSRREADKRSSSRTESHLLFRQRLHRGGSRAQDGVSVLGESRSDAAADIHRAAIMLITATRSVRCLPARIPRSLPRSGPCCSKCCGRTRLTATVARSVLKRSECSIDCLAESRAAPRRSHRNRRRRPGRADAAGRGRHDHVAAGVSGRRSQTMR